MAGNKRKTAFFCQECGYESAKWAGQCPACKAWNTMVEEPVRISPAKASAGAQRGISSAASGFALGGNNHSIKPVSLSTIEEAEETRFSTGFGELDRVLGGGAVEAGLRSCIFRERNPCGRSSSELRGSAARRIP